MYIVVSLIGAAETVILGTNEVSKECNVEDGEFQVFVPLKSKEIAKIEKEKIDIEKMFYLDFSYKNESVLRIYENRKDINKLHIEEGNIAKGKDEISIEKRFCEEHKLSIGDYVELGNNKYKITGIISALDYDAIYQNIILSFSISTLMIFLAGAGIINPIGGAFLHNIGAFVVLFNSGRIMSNQKNEKENEKKLNQEGE